MGDDEVEDFRGNVEEVVRLLALCLGDGGDDGLGVGGLALGGEAEMGGRRWCER